MNINTFIQLLSSFATLIGIWLAFLQLRKISYSLRIGQQGNTVNVIAHCVNRYEKIMGEIPKADDKEVIEIWWYRYWDLYTEEFNFFRKSLLDSDVFELWMNELATVYQLPPGQYLETRRDSHRKYLDSTLVCYEVLHKFYYAIDDISKDPRPRARSERVHGLIVEYAPPTVQFEMSYKNSM